MMFPPHELNAPMQPTGLPGGYQPSPFDVCCGRGKKNWNHEGNTIFRRLIRSNVQGYQDAIDKQEKSSIVISIVDTIRSQGGRFLKQDDDKQWYDIGDSQAREKVGHSLRDQVNAQTKQQMKEGSESSSYKRRSPSPETGSPKRPRFAQFAKAKFGRSNSCPARSAPAVSQVAQEQQQLQQVSQQPTLLQSVQQQSLPLAGQVGPSFLSVRHPSLEQMSYGEGSFSLQVPPQESVMSSGILPVVPQHAASSTNWNLIHERTTPEQGRVQMPNFFHPLDASIEPTPIEQMLKTEDGKTDEQKDAGVSEDNLKPMAIPPRPPF
mmetsp:Transcript_14491/g.31625  ORF Transcript_14491/g.31625 Transcript_14491/m.31625 type:complete len:321 (+) Transcript_14491:287-1249(+)|eukprot:CAMPEP_0168747942 /NCGR_PEP_ID=MMETSP0724-20121128/15920_1 /TAXON_ID=265536 /ORGANISM="Amphiprora sp., Strain CCMP467" /LENGTH=320 /DNA_ID=CAMNT_0008795755 /DNA_START=394 /DNA_END=1356 /DNA_ORIENTATION=-